MKKPGVVWIALAALLAAAVGRAAAAALADTPLAPERTLDRRSIGELQFSPDASRLVFTVTEPVKGAARQRNLWMLELGTRRLRQLTFTDKSDSSPKWSPDGRSIAFLSTRNTTRESAA